MTKVNYGITYWNVSAMVVLMVAVATLFGAGSAHADSNKGKNSISAGAGVEVNIGANGNALVRGAKVTSVSGSQVNANTSLGSSVLSWVVKTDSNTDFSSHKNGTSGLANIAVGDTISFRGTIDQAIAGLTVNAKQLKDWTSVETKTKFDGVVTSINTTLSSFTVAKGNSTTTVQTSSSTKFSENGDNASFADIILDAKVKIQGLFNASTSVFSATSVAIDSDNDNNWTKDDAKQWKNWVHSKVWLKLFGN